MVSPVKLISLRKLLSASSEAEFIWVCQTNTDSRDSTRGREWTPYPTEISSALESAFKRGADETFIGELYRIDFIELAEVCIKDPKQQRPIQRRHIKASLENNERDEFDTARRERLSFRSSIVSQCSTSVDTNYHGSQFVRDWVLTFTHGKLNVKFDAIFPVLINGLTHEGRDKPENEVNDIICLLNLVKDETSKMKEQKRMKKLQDCCIKLYTKQCYIFSIVNTTLRDDDRTKLNTLGPYCYLVYNCVGRHTHDHLSIRDHIKQIRRPAESQSMTVYRGDYAPRKTLEEYRQVAGRNDKYFKWLPFVSTSSDRAVAECFAHNVLYIIKLGRDLSNDQYMNLEEYTYFEDERETLLRPGARFQVTKLEFDDVSGRHLVYIKIIPSYVSILR